VLVINLPAVIATSFMTTFFVSVDEEAGGHVAMNRRFYRTTLTLTTKGVLVFAFSW